MGFSSAGLLYGLVAATSTGYGIYSGERTNKIQEQGLNRQRQAQQQAEDAARRQQKQAAEAYAAANRKQPNISDILASESELATQGPASTLLTGAGGVTKAPSRPTTLLGE